MREEAPEHEAGGGGQDDAGDLWSRRVRTIIAEHGIENAGRVLQAALALSLPDLLGRAESSAKGWMTSRRDTEAAHVEANSKATLKALEVEQQRLVSVETTRRMTLAAMVLVTVATLAGGAWIHDLTNTSTVLIAFAGLVKLVMGDAPSTELTDLAERGEK